MDRYYWFALGALGVWRLTHALVAEDGPAALFAMLRRAADGRRWGAALRCFYCLSVWVAAPFAALIGSTFVECVLAWLALSGAACLLERATTASAPGPATYWEEKEDEDAMLRQRPGESRTFGATR
jgi:hypothetical protein